jgi:hypothetical protein
LLAVFAFLPALPGLVVVVLALALLLVVPFVVTLFVVVLFVFVIDGGVGRSFDFDVFAERRDVQRIFVRGIGFGFCDSLWSAQNFLNCGFFIRLFRVFGFPAFFVFFFVVVLFILFILFFVFKDGATARGRVGIDFFADQILLGVNDAVGENGGLFVADGGFRYGGNVAFRVDIGIRRLAHLFLFMGRSAFHRFGRISGRAGEQPAGQSAARTARRAGWGRLTGNTRLRFLGFGLRFETLRFDNGSGGFDRRFAAIFG